MTSDVMIEMNSVHIWFGELHVLNDINLKINKGEKIVICGPSGSGKSTLIRCINRLEEHQRGNIIVEGTELTNDNRSVEKIRGEVGMVFQQFNLFPHLTILDNCSLAPIWVRKMPKKDGEELEVRMIDENDILLTSDDEPEQNRKKAGYVNTGGQKQMTSLPGND